VNNVKKDIHPEYYPEAKVTCACGNTWTTGSTQPELRTEVCSNCHPFFTGQQQRLVDSEGRVERFTRRVNVAEELQQEAQKRAQERAEREKARRLVEIVDEEEEVEPLEELFGDEEGAEEEE
jgi:large subunit ribosomal protein L31